MSERRLNDEQIAAIESLEGPVLVFAGAGSGKTTVLVERFVHALGSRVGPDAEAVDPGSIVTITFTEKAAAELAERIRARLREQGRVAEARAIDGAWVSTIHGFCRRLLKLYALHAGIDPYFTVLDPVRADTLAEEAFSDSVLAVAGEGGGGRLLASVGRDPLISAVRRAGALLRSHALGPDRLTWESCPTDGDELIERARTSVACALDELRRAGCGKRSVAALAAECERALDELAALDGRFDEHERIARAHGIIAGFRTGRGRPAREVEGVVLRLRDELTEVRDGLALCCVEPCLKEFRRMVEAFMVAYEERCCSIGALDFDQLLSETVDMLRCSPEVRSACRNAFQLVMVDEFQDTDPLQALIVDLIADGSLCTVGDECQSIYSFRGADIDTYREHREQMRARGAVTVGLTVNYRSHPDILRFINGVFGRPELLGGSLLALRHGREEPSTPFLPPSEPRVRALVVTAPEGATSARARAEECRTLAQELASLRNEHGVRPADIVVLLRTYTHANEYARALREQGFEADVAGGAGFFTRPDVRALWAFVRVVANVRDDRALVELLASGMAGISDDALARLAISRQGDGPRAPLWEAVSDPPPLGFDDMERLASLRDAVERARSGVGARPLAQLIAEAVQASGLVSSIEDDRIEGARRLADIEAFIRVAREFERAGGAGPAAFACHLESLARLRERVDAGSARSGPESAVRIMSIHAAKGLEFPVVAVAGLGETPKADTDAIRAIYRRDEQVVEVAMRLSGLPGTSDVEPPSFERLKEAAQRTALDEERRLLYVACTRARDVLILCGTRRAATVGEGKRAAPLMWLLGPLEADGLLEPGTRVCDHAGVRVGIRSVEPLADGEAGGSEQRPPGHLATVRVTAGRGSRPRSAASGAGPGEPVVPARLSYSDLALWLICPRRFKAERLERIGALEFQGGSAARRFGSAVHVILQAMPPGVPLDPARAEAIARSHGLPIDEVGDAIAAVSCWRSSELAARIAEMDRIATEWPFDILIEAGSEPFVLSGALDLYARTGERAVVVDYKTGSDEGEGDRARLELQARCYALAALREGCTTVEVLFAGLRPGAGQLTTLASFRYAAPDRGSIERAIASVRDRMVREGFEAWPNVDRGSCATCPARGVVCSP